MLKSWAHMSSPGVVFDVIYILLSLVELGMRASCRGKEKKRWQSGLGGSSKRCRRFGEQVTVAKETKHFRKNCGGQHIQGL